MTSATPRAKHAASRSAQARLPTPAPDASVLREAALGYLSRFAASRAGVVSMLSRRILRWQQRAISGGMDPDQAACAAEHARGEIAAVVAGLLDQGTLDDAGFARGRARSLSQSGASRRAISAHLAARGIDGAISTDAVANIGTQDALDQVPPELGAALVFARRRRLGPFAIPGAQTIALETAQENSGGAGGRIDGEIFRLALAKLARAGFSQSTARAALACDRDEAERLIAQHRGIC